MRHVDYKPKTGRTGEIYLRDLATLVSPAMAASWLANNPFNRKLNQGHLAFIMREMVEDRWRLSHQAVAIATDHAVLDGQHRLHGVVNTGLTLPMVVIHGVDRSVFLVTDNGRRRTDSEILNVWMLQTAGEPLKNANQFVAAAKLISAVRDGQVSMAAEWQKRRPTRDEVIAWLNVFPGLHEVCCQARVPNLPPRVTDAGRYLFDEVDPSLSETLFTRLRTGADLKSGDAVLLLRNLLATTASGRGYVPAGWYMACLIKTWNSLRTGKIIRNLRVGRGETFPTIL